MPFSLFSFKPGSDSKNSGSQLHLQSWPILLCKPCRTSLIVVLAAPARTHQQWAARWHQQHTSTVQRMQHAPQAAHRRQSQPAGPGSPGSPAQHAQARCTRNCCWFCVPYTGMRPHKHVACQKSAQCGTTLMLAWPTSLALMSQSTSGPSTGTTSSLPRSVRQNNMQQQTVRKAMHHKILATPSSTAHQPAAAACNTTPLLLLQFHEQQRQDLESAAAAATNT